MRPVNHLHIATPGDHYSPSTGSATMTVAYELARQHARQGGQTTVVVSQGTRHDYGVAQVLEVVGALALPGGVERVGDAVLGRLGRPRVFVRSRYRPAVRSIQDLGVFPDDQILAHNAPVVPTLLAPGAAKVSLYAHNAVLRHYGRAEAARVVGACHRVVCVSEFLASRLVDRLRRAPDTMRVVLNGVDTERFHPLATSPGTSDPLVLFLGRVEPLKGVDLLVRAAVRIASPKRRFRLRIVGSRGFSSSDPLSPYERELRRLAAPLGGAAQFVPFVGRDDVPEQYRAASVGCVPSNFDDPCPLTVLEGMACGLPMILSRRGGIPETAGTAGCFFRPPDVDSLAERLAWLLDDPGAREQLGAMARRRAVELDWSHQYAVLTGALSD